MEKRLASAAYRQMMVKRAEERKIQELKNSPFCCLRAKGRLLSSMSELYYIIFNFTEHKLFDQFILFVVILNTAVLVAETFDTVIVRGAWFLSALDAALIAIYLMEFALKFTVWRFIYFTNSWNNADFFIVVVSMIDFLMPLMTSGNVNVQASGVFQVLKIIKGVRVIRTFRVIRTIKLLQSLQAIVSTCLQSLQSMGAIIILMFTFLLMFAVIFREMFSHSDPAHFGTMFRTVFTLFQLLTLDDWSHTYSISRDNGAPHIIIFLILYIVVEYFTFLNLVMAVLVDNFQLTIKRRMVSKVQKFQDIFEDELESIRKMEEKSIPQTDEEFYQEALKLTYTANKYSEREIAMICSYLRLLAAIDQSQQKFWSQAAVLDRLVDTFFEAGEDDINTNELE